QRIVQAIERFRSGGESEERQQVGDTVLLNWLLENGLLDAPPPSTDSPQDNALAEEINRFQGLERSLPAPHRAAAIADGTSEDEFVFLRGNWRTPGERAPRDVPEILRVSLDGR